MGRNLPKNTVRVFANAARKLDNRIDHPGTVPAKVLKGILEHAPFCDDELGAEYFGGVLASSTSGVERDDRGAAFLALLGRLSTYQIRGHYVLYEMVRVLNEGHVVNLGVDEGRSSLKTFLPTEAFITALELREGEDLNTLPHVMFGLSRQALLEAQFAFGTPEHLRPSFADAPEHGIVFTPSVLGVELFLWAHGRGDLRVNDILIPKALPTIEININVPPGIRSVSFAERTLPKVAEVVHSRT